jgi:hypothetical protein
MYDPKCEHLATSFLDDRFATPTEVAGLAQAIQTAIEDWLEEHPPNETKLQAALRDFKRVQKIADSIREKVR